MLLQGQQTNVQGVLFELEELTVKTTDVIEQLEEQMKTAKQMLKDLYLQDEDFTAQDGRVSAERKMLKDIKVTLDQKPELHTMLNQVKELQAELKEKRESVSEYATEYQRQSGTNEIQRGNARYRIQTVAKLIKIK